MTLEDVAQLCAALVATSVVAFAVGVLLSQIRK